MDLRAEISILVTPDANLRAALMFMLVELCLQKFFSFLYSDVGSNPSFVLGMDDASSVDAEISEPLLDVGDCLFFGSKHIMNLLWAPVLAKFLRPGVRPR
jgi:hypothetical protein